MDQTIRRKLILIFVFAAAMGLLEAIVVVYLREIYYPDGFKFPLVVINDRIFLTEVLREICTIVMLMSISLITGKSRYQVMAFFLFSFAIWDIIYYAGLKMMLNWPSSFLTWDILFLIPIPWLGPVLAPILFSATIIILSFVLLFVEKQSDKPRLKAIEWILLYLGAFIVFITFIWDYGKIIFANSPFGNWFTFMGSDTFKEIISNYIPDYYHWDLFALGILLIYLPIILILKRYSIKQG